VLQPDPKLLDLALQADSLKLESCKFNIIIYIINITIDIIINIININFRLGVTAKPKALESSFVDRLYAH
jgi:hypothetical protein